MNRKHSSQVFQKTEACSHVFRFTLIIKNADNNNDKTTLNQRSLISPLNAHCGKPFPVTDKAAQGDSQLLKCPVISTVCANYYD